MKKIKRNGVKERYPNLSEYEVTWYQYGYNDAVERENKQIEKLEQKITRLLENYEALEKKVEELEKTIEELQLGSPTGLRDEWTRYYWNEEKKTYCPKKKVIYEPC